MKDQLTAVFQKVPEGYIAFVEELPGANAKGDTLDEARSNLQEAVHLVIETNTPWTKKPCVASLDESSEWKSLNGSPSSRDQRISRSQVLQKPRVT